MKNKILVTIKNNKDSIKAEWCSSLAKFCGNRITVVQIEYFVDNTLKLLSFIAKDLDYSTVDKYLIETCSYFHSARLTLLDASQFFNFGKLAINRFCKDRIIDSKNVFYIHDAIDVIFEHLFARFSSIYNEFQIKEVTEEKNKLAALLEINSRQMKTLFSSSNTAIITVTDQFKISLFSPGAENILGYKDVDVIGKDFHILVPPGDKYKIQMGHIGENLAKHNYVKVNDTELLTKSLQLRPVEIDITRLPDKDGVFIATTFVIRDISDIQILQKKMMESEKLVVVGQLAAGIAHEIGNPLTSISSIVQLLIHNGKNDIFLNEQLSELKTNINRIAKIVQELVDFSRPPDHEIISCKISTIIKSAIGIAKYDERARKTGFEYQFDDEDTEVFTSPDLVLQVFLNILVNALDAINNKGKIIIHVYKNGTENISIDISDNGRGMDEFTVSKVFEPFFTTKSVGKGSGLGLSVSYGIIQKLNGTISVKSSPGKGSCFTIQLPLCKN